MNDRFEIKRHPFANGKLQLVDYTMNCAMRLEGANAFPIVVALLKELKNTKSQEDKMTITMQRTDTLKPTKHNPAHRTSRPYIADLLKSIKKVGVLYPLLVTPSGFIGDGNRRHAACLALGIKEVPTIISDVDPSVAYAEINSCAKRLTGSDHLSVYLQNPAAVTDHARKTMAAMTNVIGRATVKYMVGHGGSVATYKQARNVGAYAGIPKNETRVVVRWLLDEGMTYKARKALEDNMDPIALRAAILEKRGIGKVWA